LPYCRFPWDYKNPTELIFAGPGSLRECAFVLQLRSVAELSMNRTEEALEDIRLALRLADLLRPEPFFNSQKARIQIVGATLQPVWEGLAAHRWSDSQLAALQSEFSALDFLADYATMVRGERAFACAKLDFLRRTHNASIVPESMSDGEGNYSPDHLLGFYFHSFPSGWYYQNQLQVCRAYTEEMMPLLDAKTRTVSERRLKNKMSDGNPIDNMTDWGDFHYISMREWEHPLWHPYDILEGMVIRAAASGQYAYAQGSLDLARVACALERYRLWKGEYPASLDALAPRFMDRVPHDVINGQPLHYRLTDNRQFVLYSVGWKNKDDGGKVLLTRDPLIDVRDGNWVWRYP
jgi:hypothetical protein